MLMKLTLLKSKIHRATVTAASLHYEGSLTISADLAALVQLREYEKILVGNLRNGERFETYVIYGSPRKGSIQLNGATAHLGTIGDRITIMNFAHYSPEESRPPSAADHCPRREESGCSQGRHRAVTQSRRGIRLDRINRIGLSACKSVPEAAVGIHPSTPARRSGSP